MDKQIRDLRCEFIKYGLMILIWACFVIYQVTRIASNPLLYGGTIWPTTLSFIALIALIAILGAGLYRKSALYIRWYQGVFDSLPISVIVTDKDAAWRQANKMARKTVNVNPWHNIEKLNSRHLIGADGNVLKRMWKQGPTEYRVTGSRLCVNGEDAGHIILFYNMSELTGSNGTRTELIDEINRLLGQLSDATVHFDGYAKSFAGHTMRQAGIIHELSDVIVGIASGTISGSDELNKKMGAVKEQMQLQEEGNRQQIDKIHKTVVDIAAARNSINGVLHDIDSVRQSNH